jgi:hypothetical protein
MHCNCFFIQLSSKTVFERGLVEEQLKPREILKNYESYCKNSVGERSFENSLAYVTPVSVVEVCRVIFYCL